MVEFFERESHWRFTVTNLALPFSLNFIPMNFDHPTLQNKNVRFAYGTPPIFFCHHHNLTACNIVVLQLTIKPWPTPPSTIYLIDNVSYDFRSRKTIKMIYSQIPLDPHWKTSNLPLPSSVRHVIDMSNSFSLLPPFFFLFYSFFLLFSFVFVLRQKKKTNKKNENYCCLTLSRGIVSGPTR